MKQTRFLVVRHGETEWNAEGKWMGQLDSALTSKGVEQARQLAGRIGNIPLDAIYSSDLGRAAVTAKIIADGRPLEVTFDRRLRERHLGIFQGLTVPEMRARYPKERTDYERLEFDYVIPEGETARQRVERSMACLNELAARFSTGSILIVTHGGILTGLLQHVLGIPPEMPRNFKLPNAALNVFLHSENHWALETWGDTAHLQTGKMLNDSVR